MPEGRILIAEDNSSLRFVVKEILSAAGYTVSSARNGEEAVRIYLSNFEEIDAVVTDAHMPHLDGREVIREIRSINPNAKILLMSGSLGQDIPCLTLLKPFTREELLKCICHLLADAGEKF